MKIHPNETKLEELLLSLDCGHREVLDHLLRCPACRSRLFYLPRQPEAERAGLEVAARVAGFLRRAQHDPEAVFEKTE